MDQQLILDPWLNFMQLIVPLLPVMTKPCLCAGSSLMQDL